MMLGFELKIRKHCFKACLCSFILVCRYRIDSSVKDGDNTTCTTSLRSIIVAHTSSCSGTLLPTISGINLNKVEFSCPFPPMLSLDAKFLGIGWGLLSLSECWYGNVRIFVFRYSKEKYFR